jgi:hypothetical protein
MALDHAAQAGRHPLSERGFDFYATPPCAVEALLGVERLPRCIWEPCAGDGAIVRVLRDRGHTVIASDVVDRGFRLHFCRDFLGEIGAPAGVEMILTNPPYAIADRFVEHALQLCPLVVVLLRLGFLESQRRTPILEGRGLERVHLFRKRLPMMHRHGWAGRRASSAIPFAWFVWNRAHTGPTTINRISWGAK